MLAGVYKLWLGWVCETVTSLVWWSLSMSRVVGVCSLLQYTSQPVCVCVCVSVCVYVSVCERKEVQGLKE